MDENMTLSGAPPEEILAPQTDLEIPVMQENDKSDRNQSGEESEEKSLAAPARKRIALSELIVLRKKTQHTMDRTLR